jgi:GcrA cell cycle regulator
MHGQDDPWADGTLAARLRKLWAAKDKQGNTLHSTASIGRQLGMSKNAIVGKAHRLDLPSRPSPIKRSGKTPKLAARPGGKPPKVTLPSLAGDIPFPQSVPAATVHVPTRKRALTVVTRKPKATPIAESTPAVTPPKPYGRIIECCWPIGVPGTKAFRFCGDPSEPGRSYCPDHCKRGFVRIRDLREDAA